LQRTISATHKSHGKSYRKEKGSQTGKKGQILYDKEADIFNLEL